MCAALRAEARAYDALTGGPRGNGKLSQGPGLLPGHSGGDAGLDNRLGWRRVFGSGAHEHRK